MASARPEDRRPPPESPFLSGGIDFASESHPSFALPNRVTQRNYPPLVTTQCWTPQHEYQHYEPMVPTPSMSQGPGYQPFTPHMDNSIIRGYKTNNTR